MDIKKVIKNRIGLIFYPVLVIGLLYISGKLILINDDYMALYTTWLISQEYDANVDFNVDSYTLLFDLLAPFYVIISNEFEIIYIFRFIFTALLLTVSFQLHKIITHLINSKVAYFSLALLFTSYAVVSRGLDIRPDILILIFWLQTFIVLYIKDYSENKKLFLAGIFFVLSILFKFKAMIIVISIINYIIFREYRSRSINNLMSSMLYFILGSVLCFVIFYTFVDINSFKVFIETSTDLFKLSIDTHKNLSVSLDIRGKVFKHFALADALYFSLSAFGVYYFITKYKNWSAHDISFIVSISLMSIASVGLNPHYHSYNLVTLYSLLLIFVAITIDFLTNKIDLRLSFKLYLSILISIVLIAKSMQFIFSNSNSHQISLFNFISKNTTTSEHVFAYEGLGLYRKSTYHWRTSAIKLYQYHSGEYNIWEEIMKVKPVLIIESYRIPEWLTPEDKVSLYDHYVSISPHILTIGLSTETNLKGNIILSGYYTVKNSELDSCFLNNIPYKSHSKLWLDEGEYNLASYKGNCVLHWYFAETELDYIRDSNISGKPYLVSP